MPPPPAKVKQSRKLLAVGRRTDGVHDDDGDVVLAEAGGRARAGTRVRRRADRGRTDGGTGLAAVQKCHFAYYEQGEREAFLHPRTLPQPRRGNG